MVRRAALVAAFVFLLSSAGHTWSLPIDALGRLTVDRTFLCTAFVVRSEPFAARAENDRWTERDNTIYRNWVVTAGHCVQGVEQFQYLPALGSNPHWGGRVVGFSGAGQHDIAVLWFYSYLPDSTLQPAFDHMPAIGDPLLLIGYGRRVLMARVGPLVGYDDRGHMVISSYATKGNSGAPVLIPGTRLVVGVGIETTLDAPPYVSNPYLYCLLAPCGVKPPYYAVHIDRLRGLIRWR